MRKSNISGNIRSLHHRALFISVKRALTLWMRWLSVLVLMIIKDLFPMDKRLEMIRGLFADEPLIRVEADCLRWILSQRTECRVYRAGIRTRAWFWVMRKPLPISIGSWRNRDYFIVYRARTDFYQFYYCRELLQFGKRCYRFCLKEWK